MTTTADLVDPRRSILVGLLGQGVKPSLTPEMHEREAWRQGIRYVYKIVDLSDRQVAPDHLRGLLGAAVELGFDALNITHPIKQAMVPLLDQVSPGAEAIGAVNTVLVVDGMTVGHNTDVTGFGRAFREGIPDAALDEVVLLGAGGAGTAVAHALVNLGARRLLVFDPDDVRAEALARSARQLSATIQAETVGATAVATALSGASGVVNATPVGMAAHPGMPLAAELLRPELWVADIVYRPIETQLLRTATDRGCRTLSGAGMAVHQSADTFELVTGRSVDREAMFHDFDEMVAAEVQPTGQVTTPAREAPAERNP